MNEFMLNLSLACIVIFYERSKEITEQITDNFYNTHS